MSPPALQRRRLKPASSQDDQPPTLEDLMSSQWTVTASQEEQLFPSPKKRALFRLAKGKQPPLELPTAPVTLET
eukprot:CAMPEP_0181332192 /NCGR_PEP_ID=MMETSP1101-20121128/24947_1 /TAXON_ID=46948 /ORGANISM="Rhodomonas abbreviata, Strain Caron Lab Isolate" /LENGTH=73 /DNA_ID=CAMNT_0023441789 /DNA_START=27 /DNA_END=245 /DNA_ORIENTATION=+